jgi:hypothetical protein
MTADHPTRSPDSPDPTIPEGWHLVKRYGRHLLIARDGEDNRSVGPPRSPDSPTRSTFLLLADFERVEEWCRGIRLLFGRFPYLVGSALRLILADDEFDAEWSDPVKVRLMNRALSTWGQRETGLPIDFQIQRQSNANERWPGGVRNPMGGRDWSLIVPEATEVPA